MPPATDPIPPANPSVDNAPPAADPIPPATPPSDNMPPSEEPMEVAEAGEAMEVAEPVTSVIGENTQKIIREFFFKTERKSISWQQDLNILNSFAASISKLHPLRDGMTLFGISQPNQNQFTVELNRTLTTLDKEFEVSLAYIDAKLPKRRGTIQVVEVKLDDKVVTGVGIAFEIEYSDKKGIAKFIEDVNGDILTNSGGVPSGKLPELRLDEENQNLELVVNIEERVIYSIEFKGKHTLDFLDFEFPNLLADQYPGVLPSKKAFSTFSHIFVYCSIAALGLANGELQPLLSILPTGQHQSSLYVPLGVDRFSKITFKLTDENQLLIPPTEEKVYVLLHFQEKKT